MLPWVEIPAASIGGWTFQPYPLFLLAAVLSGRLAFLRATAARGFDRGPADAAYWLALAGAILAVPVFLFAREPALLLSDLRTWPGMWTNVNSAVCIAGGAAAGIAFAIGCRYSPQQAFLLADSFAWAFPFAWTIVRLGCAWTHHHPGIAADGLLSVAYPGRPRYDLALLEAILCIALLAVWAALRRTPLPPGGALGIVLTALGGFRCFAASQLHRGASGELDFAGAALAACGAAALGYAGHRALKLPERRMG